MRVKETGSPASAATINTQVAAVKALLGFAHKVGFTRFNAAPLIKLKKAPRQLAQRILSEVEVNMALTAASDPELTSQRTNDRNYLPRAVARQVGSFKQGATCPSARRG